MKSIRIVLALLLALALVSGCATTGTSTGTTADTSADTTEDSTSETTVSNNTPDSPYFKYEPGITISMIRSVDTNREFMEGETWDNNLWTEAYKERLGISFEYPWTTMPDEYSNKVNMAIASNDLPDYFAVTYDQFYRLAAAGQLADLTPYIDSIGSDAMLAAYEADGGLLRMQMTYDDKVMALGEYRDLTGAGHMLWYRDDWAEKLGLSTPQTPEDLWDMAEAFATGDPNGDGSATVGFGVCQSLWGAGMGLDGWFAMDGAYPTIWIEKADGTLAYGAVEETNKITLRKLQDAYKKGIIDNDFINKGDWVEAPDDIVKMKIGMVIGPIWFGDWKLKDVMMAMGDNSATWTSMPVPQTKTPFDAKPANVYVVNAKAEHPAAAVLISNLTGELLTGVTAEGKFHDEKDAEGNIVNNFFHALAFGYNEILSWNLYCAEKVTAALESGDTSELNAEQLSYYDRSKAYVEWKPGDDPTVGLAGYTSYSIFGPEGSQYVGDRMNKEGLQLMNAYYGPNTDTMNENLGNLNSKRNEIFTAIIMGQDVDAGFDEWVTFWNAMQGEKITEEVNAWYTENK